MSRWMDARIDGGVGIKNPGRIFIREQERATIFA